MKKQSLVAMLLLFSASIVQAAEESALAAEQTGLEAFGTGLDGFMANTFGWFVDMIFFSVPLGDVSFPLIVGWLLVAAIVFTLYFSFIQFRLIGLSLDIVRGKYTDPNPAVKEEGEVSHFQALATALSGTVGLGNIAGVGAALAIGGPGATFWMIVVGLFGMASKFVECTLGVKYRTILPSGAVSGGPMYYLSRGMAERGMGGFGKVLAVGFALMTILATFGAGNMFQGNQAFAMVSSTFSIPTEYSIIFGVVLAVLVGSVILGGMPRIATVTEKIVPFMALLYITMAVIVLVANFNQIGTAFEQIFVGAFTGAGVAGGFIGALIQGLKRATFSNEAGVGSAAIAHSAVKTNEPATEGLVALLEPFIDTVIICTMTALVITISGVNTAANLQDQAITGVELTRAAFMQTAPIFQYFLALAVIMFAFSTMISWSYYGLKAWTYLFGEGRTKEIIYKLIFLVFVVIGTVIQFGFVIDFADAALFAMAIFNIIGLYFLMPVVKKEVKSYVARVKSGEIKKFK
ncbi:sodium:alanine symporter family protein [Psychrobacter sp. M13]|uniref:alanine/glycine:cation symporter family protein n=1 Tax=Psychrobacter sp. M13 TaxID=3067275 RepID=UPI00273AC36E|nr:alanine/glycine:cation symporter family protein [Psychrobacter sp. M13]WLP94894.1 alanine/glycine:cation symporter family protein [Psychrobacter sp. M13]